MKFEDFYEIAEYGNTAWRGYFTPKEVAQNAHDYFSEFNYCKENDTITSVIKNLAKLLAEDGAEQCREWLYQIASELNLIDMDYHDYLGTDEWLDILELE